MVLERIKQYIDLKGITVAAFERSIGMSNASFGKSLKQGKGIGSDKLENILSIYPDLNAIWLLTGTGEMLNTNDADGGQLTVREAPSAEIEKIIGEQLVPVYEFHMATLTGLLSGKIKPSSYMYLPNLPKCDGATPMPGDSMEPEIQRGDLIVYRKVKDFYRGLFLGQIYYLTFEMDGHEYSMIRYILAADDDQSVRLVSTNKRYAHSDIPKDSIKELAMIMASVRHYTMV